MCSYNNEYKLEFQLIKTFSTKKKIYPQHVNNINKYNYTKWGYLEIDSLILCAIHMSTNLNVLNYIEKDNGLKKRRPSCNHFYFVIHSIFCQIVRLPVLSRKSRH